MSKPRKARTRGRNNRHQILNRYKGVGWQAIAVVLQKHSVRDLGEEDKNAFLLPIHMAVMRWRTGDLTNEDYIRLNEFNAFAFCLSGMLFARGTEDTKAVIRPMADMFNRVGEVLKDLGDRWCDKGTYTAKAEELLVYQGMLAQLDALLDVADLGAVTEALRDAKRMCEDSLPGPEYQQLRRALIADKLIDKMLEIA